MTTTEALSVAMGSKLDKVNVQTDPQMQAYSDRMNDPHGYIKVFLCPAHTTDVLSGNFIATGSTALGADEFDDQYGFEVMGDVFSSGGGYIRAAPTSYVYSEYVLGWSDYGEYASLTNPATINARLRGKAASVRHPELTFLAGDGLATSDRGPFVGGAPPTGTLFNSGVGPAYQVPTNQYPSFPRDPRSHLYSRR